MTDRFWENKPLFELSDSEWEALCDGCGKCCLIKLEDEDSGEVAFTNLHCQYFDMDTCRCNHYSERSRLVPDCLDLRKHFDECLPWLPTTCAYKRLATGEPLADWHYLISGRHDTIHEAGVSIRSYAQCEKTASDDLNDHLLIDWSP
ncbi:MAG: YcgN family cysteine cluster protein [Gammaproteobacteria bacterium]|nr:YcgN family cysteine cluster protein [Gammaproteobacteria bacterium]